MSTDTLQIHARGVTDAAGVAALTAALGVPFLSIGAPFWTVEPTPFRAPCATCAGAKVVVLSGGRSMSCGDCAGQGVVDGPHRWAPRRRVCGGFRVRIEPNPWRPEEFHVMAEILELTSDDYRRWRRVFDANGPFPTEAAAEIRAAVYNAERGGA